MTKLKFLAIGFFAFLTLNLSAQKHAHKSPEQRQQKHLEHMAKELNLSPAQLSQVKTLQDKYFDPAEKAAHRGQHQEHRAEVKAKLATILTPEQLKKAEAMEAEHEAKRAEKRAERAENHKDVPKKDYKKGQHKQHKGDKKQHLERMGAELGLSEAQKAEVKAVFEAEKEANKAEHKEKQALKRERKQAYEAELMPILNAEQKAKYEEMRAKRAAKSQEHKARKAAKN